MTQNFDGSADSERDRFGSRETTGESIFGAPFTSTPTADATAKLNEEFNRVARALDTGSKQFRDFGADEIAALRSLLEEKRAESLAGETAAQGIEYWQFKGRVHHLLFSDPRAVPILAARDERRRSTPEGPVRFLGFHDDREFRKFKFGRLPSTDASRIYRVSVAWAFFSRDNLSLQEGPGLCSAILSGQATPTDCEATAEDVQRFIESRPVKSRGKGSGQSLRHEQNSPVAPV